MSPPNYVSNIQYTKAIGTPYPLSKGDKKFVMQVTGKLIFYARAIGSTILPDLSNIASEQNYTTNNTTKRFKQLLDYAASQEEAIITFNASVMACAIYSYAYYLSVNNERSCAGGHHLLSSDEENQSNTGAILNLPRITCNVMSSEAEEEPGALFLNAKTAVPMRNKLGEIEHLQL